MRERYEVNELMERDREKSGIKHKKLYAITDKKRPLPNEVIAVWQKRYGRFRLPERYTTREEAQKECDRLNQENIKSMQLSK